MVGVIELPRKVSQSQIKTPSVQTLCGTGVFHTISHAQLASGGQTLWHKQPAPGNGVGREQERCDQSMIFFSIENVYTSTILQNIL
jgi:hypothetical protein